ncbi:phage protease [Sodalis sp. (in: enterobacteria)]|uniref:phage protease n=1 Tax=Sodalis sp. (in: enterobacteria) TaxID=1898979 RepID=UPI003F6884BF
MALESAGTRVQLFPAGTFRSRDTRPTDVAHWRLEEPRARRLINAAQARLTPYHFDYEHQATHARCPGKWPARAGRRLVFAAGMGRGPGAVCGGCRMD